jgi:predicted HTH domain antitoxin
MAPHDYGEHWDASDDLELVRLWTEARVSLDRAAELLGRTPAGVRTRLYRLRVTRSS